MLSGRLGRSRVQSTDCGEHAMCLPPAFLQGNYSDTQNPVLEILPQWWGITVVHGEVLVGLCLWRAAEEVGVWPSHWSCFCHYLYLSNGKLCHLCHWNVSCKQAANDRLGKRREGRQSMG